MSPSRLCLAGCCAALLLSPSHAQTSVSAFTNAAATSAPPVSTSTAPMASAPTTPAEASAEMIKEALAAMNANDVTGALNKLTEAIRLNPGNSGALVLRASIYCQQKQWNLAEQDFKAAQALAPGNVALKFNVIEVKFLQKQYDAARAAYLPLENDPVMGDFAAYKVFLCDLAGGHEPAAQKELDVFNKAGSNPSYFFSNAAWSIVHKKYDDARSWLESAANIYPQRKNAYYTESLLYLGYLPLPGAVPDGSSLTPSPDPTSNPSQ